MPTRPVVSAEEEAAAEEEEEAEDDAQKGAEPGKMEPNPPKRPQKIESERFVRAVGPPRKAKGKYGRVEDLD